MKTRLNAAIRSVGGFFVLAYQIVRGRKRGLLRLRRVNSRSSFTFECQGAECALCCIVLGSPSVAPEEKPLLPESELSYDVQRGLVIRSKGGQCRLLKDGLCSCYEVRPHGCAQYPWYNINSELFVDIGCPGVHRGGKSDVHVQSISPAEEFFALSKSSRLWTVLVGILKRW